MWDDITYQFPNFNGTTVEIWESISNLIPHFKMYVITYPCCNVDFFLDRMGLPYSYHENRH